MEVTVNVQAFKHLKRVLSSVPESEFNIANWNDCACGHARRDAWFQSQGFSTCYSFAEAAAFFGVSRNEAICLFSGPPRLIPPREVIKRIDTLLATDAQQHAWRQAVIDGLLATANKAAQKAKSVATILAAALF